MKQIMMKGKQRVKGTVLFTVVSVMMIMVVFLMSTLILTTSANRRSYYTYYHTQAEYAAQSALDCITNYAYSNAGFSQWVGSIADDDPHEVFIEFKDSQMPLSDPNAPESNIRCTVQKEKDNYIYDEITKKIHQRSQWKIVATAVVGKGRNQTSCQKATYLYANVRMPKSSTAVNTVGYLQYIYDEKETSSSTYVDDPSSPFTPIANAVYSLAPTGTNDNVVVLGPQFSGMTDVPKGRTKYGNTFQKMENNVASVGEGIFVGSFRIDVTTNFVFQRKGEGLQYYGNLDFGNKNTIMDSNIDPTLGATEWPYQKQNYLFVDGVISADGTDNRGGGISIGYNKAPGGKGNTEDQKSNRPINVFAGGVRIDADNKGMNVCGDVYLYDPDVDSVWVAFQDSTLLRKFVEKEVSKNSGYPNYSGTHGNLVCNNKSLTFGHGVNTGTLTIEGDLIFTNPTGHVTIDCTLDVGGKAIFACPQGNVNIKSGALNAAGGVTYNKNETELKRILEASSGDENKIGKTALASYVSNGRDYSLFPFNYRLDEIFAKYYRWDLANDTNWSADPLVKESTACGHTWATTDFNARVFDKTETVTLTGVSVSELQGMGVDPYNKDRDKCSNERWDAAKGENVFDYRGPRDVYKNAKVTVPYTTPVNASNIIITKDKVFEPLDASKAAATVSKRDDMSYSDIASFRADMVNETGGKLADPASVKGTNLSVTWTYPDGTKMATKTTDVYYVNQDCEIDMNEINRPVFIDPSQAASLPLRVAIKGSMKGKTILINNTAQYKGGKTEPEIDRDYMTPVKVDGKDKYSYFGRQDVYLFLETGVDLEKALITTTAVAGGFANANPRIEDKGIVTLDLVSNPYYPDSTEWAGLKTTAEKQRFLFVPNDVIFGQKEATYAFKNGGMFVGAVMMPYSTVEHKTQAPATGSGTNALYYREDHSSLKHDPGAERGIVCIGSMVVSQLKGSNRTMMIYLGDGNRKGGRTEQKIKKTTPDDKKKGTNNDDPAFNGNKDYLSNDHQGLN